MTQITHEELIAAGYKEREGFGRTKDFSEGFHLRRTDWCWLFYNDRLFAEFSNSEDMTIAEAESFAHLLHAASQGLPKVREVLEYLGSTCNYTECSANAVELMAKLTAAIAELGGVG